MVQEERTSGITWKPREHCLYCFIEKQLNRPVGLYTRTGPEKQPREKHKRNLKLEMKTKSNKYSQKKTKSGSYLKRKNCGPRFTIKLQPANPNAR